MSTSADTAAVPPWFSYAQGLKKQAQAVQSPIIATFELTPRCNFACSMCYVRLTPQQMQPIGREHTAAEWIALAKQTAESGTLFLLLTGGEPFLRPDFREIYEALSEMGFLLTVYSNGYLIDRETADWLARRPPLKLRITMYGAANQTYQRVCGCADGFSRVSQAISLLQQRQIPLSLSYTMIRENQEDFPAFQQFAAERGLTYIYTSNILKPVRGARSRAEQVRIDLNKQLQRDLRDQTKRIPGFVGVSDDPLAHCGSNRCGYWITWDGKMSLCSFMENPHTLPFEEGLPAAWKRLQTRLSALRKPAACAACAHAAFCASCPGMFCAETGRPDQTSPAICERAALLHRHYTPPGEGGADPAKGGATANV